MLIKPRYMMQIQRIFTAICNSTLSTRASLDGNGFAERRALMRSLLPPATVPARFGLRTAQRLCRRLRQSVRHLAKHRVAVLHRAFSSTVCGSTFGIATPSMRVTLTTSDSSELAAAGQRLRGADDLAGGDDELSTPCSVWRRAPAVMRIWKRRRWRRTARRGWRRCHWALRHYAGQTPRRHYPTRRRRSGAGRR